MSIEWRADRSQVQEPFATHVNDLLDADPAEWIVVEGFRSAAQQDIDYAKGRDEDGNVIDKLKVITHAKGGQSPHNVGLAVDVALVVGHVTVWRYEDPNWQRMIAAVRASPNLHSGADFPDPDEDHIEASRWKTLAPPAHLA